MGKKNTMKIRVRDKERKTLRKRAEAHMDKKYEYLEGLADQKAKELVHELGVYQIELEMQNDDLRHAQEEIEKAYDRYVELYDNAPVGYVTSDSHGHVVMVNQTMCAKLQVTKSTLKKKDWVITVVIRMPSIYIAAKR